MPICHPQAAPPRWLRPPSAPTGSLSLPRAVMPVWTGEGQGRTGSGQSEAMAGVSAVTGRDKGRVSSRLDSKQSERGPVVARSGAIARTMAATAGRLDVGHGSTKATHDHLRRSRLQSPDDDSTLGPLGARHVNASVGPSRGTVVVGLRTLAGRARIGIIRGPVGGSELEASSMWRSQRRERREARSKPALSPEPIDISISRYRWAFFSSSIHRSTDFGGFRTHSIHASKGSRCDRLSWPLSRLCRLPHIGR